MVCYRSKSLRESSRDPCIAGVNINTEEQEPSHGIEGTIARERRIAERIPLRRVECA